MSDAGMPGISDPNEDLVRLCIENNIEFTVVPGLLLLPPPWFYRGFPHPTLALKAF